MSSSPPVLVCVHPPPTAAAASTLHSTQPVALPDGAPQGPTEATRTASGSPAAAADAAVAAAAAASPADPAAQPQAEGAAAAGPEGGGPPPNPELPGSGNEVVVLTPSRLRIDSRVVLAHSTIQWLTNAMFCVTILFKVTPGGQSVTHTHTRADVQTLMSPTHNPATTICNHDSPCSNFSRSRTCSALQKYHAHVHMHADTHTGWWTRSLSCEAGRLHHAPRARLATDCLLYACLRSWMATLTGRGGLCFCRPGSTTLCTSRYSWSSCSPWWVYSPGYAAAPQTLNPKAHPPLQQLFTTSRAICNMP